MHAVALGYRPLRSTPVGVRACGRRRLTMLALTMNACKATLAGSLVMFGSMHSNALEGCLADVRHGDVPGTLRELSWRGR